MNLHKETIKAYWGITSLIIGVVGMLVGLLFSWTHHNGYTLTCLLLIIIGAIAHVKAMKRQSKY